MKTKKHLVELIMWETETESWDATICSSGGVTHSVYIEAIDDNGKLTQKWDKTFRSRNAKAEAYEYANTIKRNVIDTANGRI
jgi:hypothetical protein